MRGFLPRDDRNGFSDVMKKTTFAKAGIALAAATGLALGGALPASAHVSVSASSTAAGSSSLLSFSLPHACSGSPTTSIAITLPEEIVSATPTVLAGWDVEKITEPMAAEDDGHGGEITERVASIVYTSTTGGLAEGFRAQFDVQLRLPDLPVGTELGFPVVQDCVEGQEIWDGDSLPTVVLTEAVAGDGHGHDHSDSDSADHGEDSADHDHGEDAAAGGSTSDGGGDVLARVFGIAGLVVGVIGIVLAITARRRGASA